MCFSFRFFFIVWFAKGVLAKRAVLESAHKHSVLEMALILALGENARVCRSNSL
jgi:hypothetical protein